MSRIGVHVKTGSRNGYGLVCDEKPAEVFAVGEGGAVKEAKEKSGGHTWGIYRDIYYYGDNPNLNNMSVAEAIAMADYMYPLLKERWLLNPADYYSAINETGANDPRVMTVANAYEMRIMQLAAADGFKMCICNLFSGTPDDGSVHGGAPNGGMETWKLNYGDHIAAGFEMGHIYGRHVYGFPDLVPLTSNTDRAFREAEWLESQGLYGGLAITELGLEGGMKPIEQGHMMSQMAQFDAFMQGTRVNRKFLVGAAWWTYGNWHGVNIENSSVAIAAYLRANPSDPWTPPEYTQPPVEETVEKFLWSATVTEQETCGIRLNDEAGLEQAIKGKGLIPVISEITAGFPGDITRVVQAGEDLEHVKPREVFVYEPGKPIRSFTDPYKLSPGFKLEVWPAQTWIITQRFGENPDNYKQYCDSNGVCLKGHNGWDIAAPMGSAFYAAVSGQVVQVSYSDGYGWHVRIQTGDNLIIYGHAASNIPVKVGQNVKAGQIIGYSGNTGNSTGPHLHFEMRRCPGLPDWPWCIINPGPYLEAIYKPPTSTGVNMRPYFRPVEAGVAPFFVLQHGSGPTEDIQVQVMGESIYVVKNHQYEHMRIHNGYVERREDTSRGGGTMYILDDGYGWSRWCPEVWAVGDAFYRSPTVRVMDKNCNPISNDLVGSWLRFNKLHPVWTSPPSNASPNGITLKNVVELSFAWSRDGAWLERYFIPPNLGPYCEWMNNSGGHSWISEIPAGRPPLQREVIHCMG